MEGREKRETAAVSAKEKLEALVQDGKDRFFTNIGKENYLVLANDKEGMTAFQLEQLEKQRDVAHLHQRAQGEGEVPGGITVPLESEIDAGRQQWLEHSDTLMEKRQNDIATYGPQAISGATGGGWGADSVEAYVSKMQQGVDKNLADIDPEDAIKNLGEQSYGFGVEALKHGDFEVAATSFATAEACQLPQTESQSEASRILMVLEPEAKKEFFDALEAKRVEHEELKGKVKERLASRAA